MDSHQTQNINRPSSSSMWSRISIGDVIQILLILGVMVAGWYKFDYRITTTEDIARTNRVAIEQIQQTLGNLDSTLGKLNQRLEDFPLHRHLPGNVVIYPNGQQPSAPR